jgi:SAM-dependent methyltransferase
MSLNNNFANNIYNDEYFSNRFGNDLKRVKSFRDEITFLNKHFPNEGNVCDVGCSTGEFLKIYSWRGNMHGMEINQLAILEAQKGGIDFTDNILNKDNYFDLIIFRGTIQHMPDPFNYISRSYNSLKPGGHLVFLATPNSNSIVYKLFNDLPALDPPRNFFIPSDKTLINVCQNVGFKLLEIDYPYLNSPYSNIIKDHLMFLITIFSSRKVDFPFWKNMMNVVFKK